MIKRIEVSARRWQNSHGNTQHVVDVRIFGAMADQHVKLTSPETYGYGWAYKETAVNMLLEAGLKLPGATLADRVETKARIKLVTEHIDVARKKDLYPGKAKLIHDCESLAWMRVSA